MKPGRIRGLDSRATAAASAGRSRGCVPGRNVGLGCALRHQRPRQWPRQAPPAALPGLGNKAAAASVG